jgi:hypothetical protein
MTDPNQAAGGYEMARALMESARNKSIDKYFELRPQITRTIERERIYEAGFEAAWDAAQPASSDEPVPWDGAPDYLEIETENGIEVLPVVPPWYDSKAHTLRALKFMDGPAQGDAVSIVPKTVGDVVFQAEVADLLHLLEFADITTQSEGDTELAKKSMQRLRAILSAKVDWNG